MVHHSAPRPRPGRRTIGAVAALSTVCLGIGQVASVAADRPAPAPSGDPAPASSLVVHADQPFRDVTHVGTGSLYGLADASNPTYDLAAAIKPHEFVLKPADGKQQPVGDILKTAPLSQRLGATVVDRFADALPGWPYQFSWDTWDDVVRTEMSKVNQDTVPNLAAYAPWNESDGTWRAANGTYEAFWTHTYKLIRSIEQEHGWTTPIQGPSLSDNISDMRNFLQNAVDTDTVPDVLAWHELVSPTKIRGDVEKVRAIESDLGIGELPIDIEEYAPPPSVGIPGQLIGYVAKFERFGISSAELAFWNTSQQGTLGDLLTGTKGQPNGAYWMYKWYADMAGQMVATTPPDQDGAFDGIASVTPSGREVDVIAGGHTGSTTIRVDGLDKTSVGKRVNVKLEYTPSYGRTVAVNGPVTISNATYRVGADGSISVPVVMNADYGYRVVVTPARARPASLAGAYTITNANSGLVLDTRGDGAQPGDLAIQAAADGTSTQTWRLTAAGRGLYRIVDRRGLALGIQDASTTNGAPALVWDDAGTADHLWQIIPNGSGRYRLANVGTGHVLAVAGMSKDPGAQVVQWADGSPTVACAVDGARAPGKLGTAFDFCGTASYVKLPTGVVSGLSGDYTVSAWVNPTSNPTWARVFDIGTGTGASMFLTVNDGSTVRYAITTGGAGGEQRIDGTTVLPANQWSLVTVTLAGSTGTLYVNGQVVGKNTAMTSHPSAFGQSTSNYLGKSQYGDPAFDGRIDDFSIYSRALSASEVATLASGQAPSAGDVVHYAFDEIGGGATVVDTSGAARNGTVVVKSGSTGSTSAGDDATLDHFWTLERVHGLGSVRDGQGAAGRG
ncbi:LamG-like jellyroll fold domain-containing protein [Nocardioides nematodiphilus]|uniref:LamG-like jellyroll fold domain-containing protein n=1 Tax=Nocardioides nematodiphilus TaxID=2849669 RepID=UPI001CD980AF|nr:LamG-like jellyroll fold domain-containing protein [Nocardioides nematodiphilus]MCA1983530.1 RICIN domain-containing protein [Nocardioides nematodiphilus]